MHNLLIIVLLTILWSTQTFADGNELLDRCQTALTQRDMTKANQIQIYGSAYCIGIVQGVQDTMRYLGEFESVNKHACFPSTGINNLQAIRVVTKYLEGHPEKLHEDEVLLAMLVFVDAFPCPGSENG